MGVVHGHGAIAALPEMTRHLAAGVDDAGIGAVRLGEGGAQAVFVLRHEDQMQVVRHQAVAEADNVRRFAAFGDQSQIKRAVCIGVEYLLPAIATLGDVVGETGNNNASKTGHGKRVSRNGRCVNCVHCHRYCVCTVHVWTALFWQGCFSVDGLRRLARGAVMSSAYDATSMDGRWP